MASKPEPEHRIGEGGLAGRVRSSVPNALALFQKLEPPTVVDEPFRFVPSSDFPYLDPASDTIIVKKPAGSPFTAIRRPGATLEIPTDEQRAEADRPNLVIDRERTRFLAESAHILTYPYVGLFGRMIPLRPERRGFLRDDGKRVFRRVDHFTYGKTRVEYPIGVHYALKGREKQLSETTVALRSDLNLGGPPLLEMKFNGNRMTSVELFFVPESSKILYMLTGESSLSKFLKGQFLSGNGIENLHYSSLKINLGTQMSIDLARWIGRGSTFNWEPREKLFRRNVAPKQAGETGAPVIWEMTQDQFIQLLSDMLLIVPASEKGGFDFARRKRAQQVRLTPIKKLLKEVERQNRPSGEQLIALTKLMEEDSRRVQLQLGFDPDSPEIEVFK